jgi:hypothetical protein
MNQDLIKLIERNGLTLHGDIEHFAEFVRADEREACAKLCETKHFSCPFKTSGAQQCADAIRARGQT